MKEEQAKEMNVVNDMYLMLQKAAKNNAEMMKQLDEKKFNVAGTVDITDTGTILDSVAWQV
jgi:hypothetical protein